MGKRIFVIDDEQMILDAIEAILGSMGHSVSCFVDSVEGERRALEEEFDLLLTDIRMPVRDGAELTEAILARKPEAKILVITAYPFDPLAKRALEAGAKGLVKKPFDIGAILAFL